MNILLVCASGMSTGLLVNKMRMEGEKRNLLNLNIFACSVDEIEKYISHYDVVLVAPQIRYKEKYIYALASSKDKGYAFIDGVHYGRVDGNKILDQAFNLMRN
ncbi:MULTISPECIES: PTS sugar transporter subunit IIB [Pelosinus]|jgi:PTS system cellobiose-specific IIB component|uniref:Phosphotransferase system lactose/cellobiose-specific IIB subunit n=1 Tax=Pelosinus fermentans B4 TaxID=1149862 RepID=I8RHH1_9FIRM|nr:MULTISPECIES: PTS sugar transporter subunit IIB [Pelosinus]EIW17325.1 phosphotransferase system lactose/cellobiose-specific IIB subunit [Pelosinus fermentans B4]EIW23384.1 phosphotransferase system lactose/cellobiose-specific IIB subunit [Pelosinus fermentans A11]OAM96495.1 phosphotransferase system lactose/cellobiose-specific IIB subunit [Pelosinus fermentans DSM 17108]SDR40765.1 PTS system, cellobiose-specific IIB component [Pelosinus fermentans]